MTKSLAVKVNMMENTKTDEPLVYDIIVRDLTKTETDSVLDKYKVDGVKRYIRLWKLGSLEHRAISDPKAFERLNDLLMKWDGKSTLDIIWGDDLKLEVFEL